MIAGATAAQANLLINGGFEIPNANYTLINPGTEPSGFGWAVTTNSVEVMDNAFFGGTFNAPEGTHSLDLVGINVGGGISQTFATQAGKSYRLSFYTGNWVNTMSLAMSVINGASTILSQSYSRPGSQSLVWQQETPLTFVATGSSATVSFQDTAGFDGNGMHLDGVDISLVPEPASMVLFGSGLLGLAASRRRKAV